MSTSYVNGLPVTDEPGASPEIKDAHGNSSEAPKNVADQFAADPFRDYFHADRWDGEANEQIKYITRILKQDGDSDQDVLDRITRIERRLGAPSLGQSKLRQIYSYIRLATSIQSEILGNL